MKKNTTLLLFSFAAFYSASQITLTQSNTPHAPSYIDARVYNNTGITTPAEGANQTYDYTNLPTPTGNGQVEFFPAVRTGFTSYTRYNVANAQLANFPLTSEYYTESNPTGIYYVGSYMFPQNINLVTVTGGVNDSIVFPGGDFIYSSLYSEVLFPNNYGDSDTSNYTHLSSFNLTVAAFALNQTPGYSKEMIRSIVETVGYGQLTLPMNGGQSIPYDVLLLKYKNRKIDSLFLNGAPAPPALISAFGLTQGDTTYNTVYKFYGENFESPLLTIEMDQSGLNATFSSYDSTQLQLDAGAGLSLNSPSGNVRIFPNPASNQLVVSTGPNDMSEKQIIIYDLLGKEVKSISSNDSQINIEVQNLTNGTYFIHINSSKETVTQKIVIHK